MKRVIEILILTVCLCFVTACGNGGAAEETTKGAAAAEQSTGTKEAQVNPDYIKKDLCDNVTVDAKVIIPDGYSGEAPIYDGYVVDYDIEKVCTALNIDFSSFTQVVDGLFKKDEKTFLNFTKGINGSFNFRTEIGNLYSTYDPDDEKVEISGYGENKELDFMSQSEVIDRVQAVLTDIGIENIRLLHIYSLPVEYHQYVENIYVEGDYLSEDKKLGDRWNDYGGCYELVFTTELNRIPLTEYYYTAADDSVYNGCEISVLYSADGIQYISASNRYRADESSAENKTLLSADEILGYFKNKFESIIMDGDYVVKEIKLCYFPQIVDKKEGKFRIIPIWQITINDEEYGDFHYRFSAVDGTEL